jgi:hypothetical protein
MAEVTQLLSALEHGDPHAASRLLPLAYDEMAQTGCSADGEGAGRGRRSGPPRSTSGQIRSYRLLPFWVLRTM